MDILGSIISVESGGLIAVVTSAMEALKRFFPDLEQQSWWARVKPVVPVVLCALLANIPALQPPGVTGAASLTMTGAMLGMANAWGYKVYKQSVRGQDKAIGEPKRGSKHK